MMVAWNFRALTLAAVTATSWASPLNKRIAQTISASTEKWVQACQAAGGADQCNPLSQTAFMTLLAAAGSCDQQNAADQMIDLAKSLNNDADMIKFTQIFTQQPRNSPDSFQIPYCQQAPKNSELNGLFQCQFDGTKDTFVGNLQAGAEGTVPFGLSSLDTPRSCPANTQGGITDGSQLVDITQDPGLNNVNSSGGSGGSNATDGSGSSSSGSNSTDGSGSGASASASDASGVDATATVSDDSGADASATASASDVAGSAEPSSSGDESSCDGSDSDGSGSDGTTGSGSDGADSNGSDSDGTDSTGSSSNGTDSSGSGADSSGSSDGSSGSSGASAATPSSSSSSSSSSSFLLQNGQKAQQLNAQFKSLTANSSCTDGEAACVGSDFALCSNGVFETTDCGSAAGNTCAALPLVNKEGTSVTCVSENEAIQRIAATGATGGLTGSD